MKNGKVAKIETDHVLIVWEDGSSYMTEFTDADDNIFEVGDEVSQSQPNQTWSWDTPKITKKTTE